MVCFGIAFVTVCFFPQLLDTRVVLVLRVASGYLEDVRHAIEHNYICKSCIDLYDITVICSAFLLTVFDERYCPSHLFRPLSSPYCLKSFSRGI